MALSLEQVRVGGVAGAEGLGGARKVLITQSQGPEALGPWDGGGDCLSSGLQAESRSQVAWRPSFI